MVAVAGALEVISAFDAGVILVVNREIVGIDGGLAEVLEVVVREPRSTDVHSEIELVGEVEADVEDGLLLDAGLAVLGRL